MNSINYFWWLRICWVASPYCRVYEVLPRKLQRLNMIGFTLIAVLLSKCVTSTDSDIIVSISHITASTCTSLWTLELCNTNKREFYEVCKHTLTAIMSETCILKIYLFSFLRFIYIIGWWYA